MEKFLETYSLPNLNQEETDNFNRLIIRDERESVLKKKLPAKKVQDHSASLGNSTKQRTYTYLSSTLTKD